MWVRSHTPNKDRHTGIDGGADGRFDLPTLFQQLNSQVRQYSRFEAKKEFSLLVAPSVERRTMRRPSQWTRRALRQLREEGIDPKTVTEQQTA
jgi:hypothetical protein